MKTVLAGSLAALLLISLPHRASGQSRGAAAEDYFAFETLGDPRFSPDGSTIAYVVTTIDQKQNRRHSGAGLYQSRLRGFTSSR